MNNKNPIRLQTLIRILIPVFFLLSGCIPGSRGRTLVIGDSNGAMPGNWVVQLQKLRPADSICNLSISGNTIGFKNNGQDTLNTLHNIEGYLLMGEKELGGIDRIIFLIGTNDCKAVFDSLQTEVPRNMEKLISVTIEYFRQRKNIPEVLIVTPPPMAADSLLTEKYKGGEERIRHFIPAFREVAEKHSLVFVNIHDSLAAEFMILNTDGVHLNEQGYKKVAEIIDESIRSHDNRSVFGIRRSQ